jgi:CheY-like chemotaxis protein
MQTDQRHTVVLNVEDTAALRYAKTKMLQIGGCDVLEAVTGAEALSLAVKHKPDVILLDILLPDLDGWEVCRRLKRNPVTAQIPVVQVSQEFTSPGHWENGARSGAAVYLTGCLEQQLLIDTIHTVLRKSDALIDGNVAGEWAFLMNRGQWLWQHRDAQGYAIAESKKRFPDIQSCMADAEHNGWVGVDSQAAPLPPTTPSRLS